MTFPEFCSIIAQCAQEAWKENWLKSNTFTSAKIPETVWEEGNTRELKELLDKIKLSFPPLKCPVCKTSLRGGFYRENTTTAKFFAQHADGGCCLIPQDEPDTAYRFMGVKPLGPWGRFPGANWL